MTMFIDVSYVILLYDREWLRALLWRVLHRLVCLDIGKYSKEESEESTGTFLKAIMRVILIFKSIQDTLRRTAWTEQHFDGEFNVPPQAKFIHGSKYKRAWLVMKLILVTIFSIGVVGGMGWAYMKGFVFVRDKHFYMAFGLYGTFLFTHYIVQSICAEINNQRNKRLSAASPISKSSPDLPSVHSKFHAIKKILRIYVNVLCL